MSIPELLKDRVQRSPSSVAHWTMDAGGKWRPTTWKDYWLTATQLAIGLQELGLRQHQKVGIMARTSQTWEFLQMAALMSGGVIVGIDPHDRNDNIDTIAGLAGLTALIVDNVGLMDKISRPVRDGLGFVVSLSETATNEAAGNLWLLENLYAIGKKKARVPEIRARSEDPATIIFTSGTTGTPKGIMYSHGQALTACSSILEAFCDIEAESNLVCWLPLSNLFQRMVNFCAIGTGASTYFVEKPAEVVKHLSSINPHIFIGVPRFFEKLQRGMIQEIGHKPAWARKMVEWAIKTGNDHARALREQGPTSLTAAVVYKIADAFILKRIRAVLGANLRYMVSGSAPMPHWLLEWFHALGIVILEAYGISENIVPIAANRPHAFRFGTVGRTLTGNEVVIAGDGELLVRGPGICSGYYGGVPTSGDPAKGSFAQKGYLATGDFAEIDEDGFISLTGRKSEIFKTSTGRRIAPVGIESCLLKIPYVENAVVFGAGRKAIIALLAIPCPLLFEHASARSIGLNPDKLHIPEEMYPSIRKDVEREVGILPKYQRPVGLILSPHPFTVEGGELTSNLKLRRKVTEQKYKEYIESVYAMVDNAKEPFDMVICSL